MSRQPLDREIVRKLLGRTDSEEAVDGAIRGIEKALENASATGIELTDDDRKRIEAAKARQCIRALAWAEAAMNRPPPLGLPRVRVPQHREVETWQDRLDAQADLGFRDD